MNRHEDPSELAGMLPGAIRREQSVTNDWHILRRSIDGVAVKEVRSVLKQNGYLTEIYRRDWQLDGTDVDQVFQIVLNPGVVEAWHMHARTVDRFFASTGRVKIVLYDARRESPTYQLVSEYLIGTERPALLIVPPGVWHGVQNISDETAVVLNLVDHAYVYEGPDHWGLPADTEEIPYRF